MQTLTIVHWPGILVLANRSEKLRKFKCCLTQRAFTCSKSTIETLEQGVKCVQS